MNFFKKISSKKWKISEGPVLAVLIFLSIAGLVAGLWQISRNIKTPFSNPIVELPEEFKLPDLDELLKTDEEKQAESLAELQKTDTDGDGLSNYDELYIYTTSPYLSDSDSDGQNDKSEIEAGQDPNCIQGQACQGSYYQPSAQGVNQTTGQTATEDLRAMLQGIGVSQSILDSLTDEQLAELYQQTVADTGMDISDLANTNTAGMVNAPVGENPQEITYEILKEFQAPQIRELLKESGLDEETLNQVDDETLEYMYQKAFFGGQELVGEETNTNNSIEITF